MSLTLDEFNAGMAAHREAEHQYQADKAREDAAQAKIKADNDAVDKQHQIVGQMGIGFLGESFALASSRSPQQAIQTGMKMTVSAIKLAGALVGDLFGAAQHLGEDSPEKVQNTKNQTSQGPAVSSGAPLGSSPPPTGGGTPTSPSGSPSAGISASQASQTGNINIENVKSTDAESENSLKDVLKQSFIIASNGNATTPAPISFYKPNVGNAGITGSQANSEAWKLAM